MTFSGRTIYKRYCQICHGENGDGNGLNAVHLPFKPANFKKHFHLAKNYTGDSYLFWRVSIGGTVKPFKSLPSAMPAFKDILSHEQIWEVLSYIHQKFHGIEK